MSKLHLELHPIISAIAPILSAQGTPPNTPILFGYTFAPFAVSFSWLADGSDTIFFELRLGADWDTATFVVKTPSNGAAIDPLTTGTHHYLLKSINSASLYSLVAAELDVVVPTIAAPVVSGNVVDNNVLLNWTVPASSFAIDHYNVYNGVTLIGTVTGTFTTTFEMVAGTYTYNVEAVDAAGNIGAQGSVILTVNQPPDFELQAILQFDISLGSRDHVYYDAVNVKLIAPVELAESWENHFISQSWTDPQDQVDAGYAIYFQENVGPGIWTSEEMDIGTVINNTICTIKSITETFAGTAAPTVSVEIRAGLTPGGGTFTPGDSQFLASVRYVTVRFTITGAGADSMLKLWDVSARLAVKNEVDSNEIQCYAADASGTVVLIPGDPALGHGSKTFSDVNSITLACKSTSPLKPLFNFVDAPYPTQFKILVFDNTGRRVDTRVSWKVRG
ncbi:MAG: hypothetical protein ACRD32_06965, partial [Nitrososphaerales archaeon]